MAEAAPSLSPKARMVAVLARQKAKLAIKREVLASGAKWSELSSRTVNELAGAYCEANRDALIAQATATIANSPTLRAMLKREQRGKPCSNPTISVHKLGAKWRGQ
jgi:hypothetical protein